MAEQVFLHVGLPKTGTTYLQGVLWANRDVLERHGLLLPGGHHRRHLLASLDLRGDPKLARRHGDVAHPWQDLVEEVNRWSGRAIITHEFFAAASAEQASRAARAFGDAEVHVVLTARAMVDLGISRWQEWVRNGGVQDIDSFPVREAYDPTDEWGWGSSDLADVLDRWGEAVPHDRVHVLPVKPGAAPPEELWRRFAGVVGVDPSVVEAPPREDNRSLGLVETEVLRRINGQLKGFKSAADRGHWIRDVLAGPTVLGQISTREKFRPGDEKLADLEARGRRAVATLREGNFNIVGDENFLQPSDVLAWRHPSQVGEDEMLAASVRANALLLGALRQVTRERNALQGAPDHRSVLSEVARMRRGIAGRLKRGNEG